MQHRNGCGRARGVSDDQQDGSAAGYRSVKVRPACGKPGEKSRIDRGNRARKGAIDHADRESEQRLGARDEARARTPVTTPAEAPLWKTLWTDGGQLGDPVCARTPCEWRDGTEASVLPSSPPACPRLHPQRASVATTRHAAPFAGSPHTPQHLQGMTGVPSLLFFIPSHTVRGLPVSGRLRHPSKKSTDVFSPPLNAFFPRLEHPRKPG